MYEIQRFALEKIYCAPSQDRQFSFILPRVTLANSPAKRMVAVYNVVKALPDTDYHYHVFVIGNLNPNFLNLVRQAHDWYRDVWINVQEDMNARNYIFQVYNDSGVMYPREYLYYSFIDEATILVALRVDESIRRLFDHASFKYLRVYSNNYFSTEAFANVPGKIGIKCSLIRAESNVDKVAIQNTVAASEVNGGKTFVYVNGYHTDNVNLNIPDHSFIEIVYDQSILSCERYNISDLRTFESTKDGKLKYLLFRDKLIDAIQYDDDNEIYISTKDNLVNTGLFFYEHKDYVVRNVTDKDYSLYTAYVNNQATILSSITTGALSDKVIVLYTRKSGVNRTLVYNATKLHELYKLPQDVERDVLSNTNYTITELRAESLENSDYFKLASLEKLTGLTSELSTSAVGYNGVTYYHGYTPSKVVSGSTTVDVPFLYKDNCYAFEYDSAGRYLSTHITNGPLYTLASPTAGYVEFIKGTTPNDYGEYYLPNSTITVRDSEYRVLSAHFLGASRISNWEDITSNSARCVIAGNLVTVNEASDKKIKVVYFDQPNVYDLQISPVDSTLYFPLTITEDRGTGLALQPLDIPFKSIEIFLNQHRLTYKLDYFIKFPYISICNKSYLDCNKDKPDIHIRMHGYTISRDDINKNEITGFVNNGALTRNRYYDIRDDRVYSVFVGGKMYDRSKVIYSEEDNTVRLVTPINGLPYTIAEHFIPTKSVTGGDSLALYDSNVAINDKISGLFNIVFKEPHINEFNVISDHHYLFSPIISKVIYDMLDGNISPSLYTTPYDDSTILNLLQQSPYKELLALDPIKHNMPDNLVEIHPTADNTVVNVNLFMYRFISRVVYLVTEGKPEKINLSGYLRVTTTV